MKQLYIYFLLILSAIAVALPASAFPVETYADSSVLATGRWVKIAVPTDGLYLLTNESLRRMGFADPSRVTVRGYGGHRLSDVLSAENYLDDLPQVQVEQTDRGLIFYGLGGGTTERLFGRLYHRPNDYSVNGFYFVGELGEGEERPAFGAAHTPTAPTAPMTFIDYVQHEQEVKMMPGEAGPVLVGEDFKYTPRRKFRLALPGAVASSSAGVHISFITDYSGSATLLVEHDGKPVTQTNTSNLRPTTKDNYTHGMENLISGSFTMPDTPSPEVEIALTFSCSGSLNGAWLNYLNINYERELKLPAEGLLTFMDDRNKLVLQAPGLYALWDVTNPANIKKVNYTAGANDLVGWTNMQTDDGTTYAAFRADASFAEPKVIGVVTPQNLHAHTGYDMAIVAPAAFLSHAERLAEFHRTGPDSLRVSVVTPEQIYNEFSSGVLDVGGIRRYFKMLYDRGAAAGRPFRYAILMGRVTTDNRGLSSQAPNYPTVPAWSPVSVAASLSDILGFCTDDYMAMLDDDSGAKPRFDKLSIALGRLPVVSEEEARDVVDKIIQYARNSKKSAWKHRFMFLADDQDGAIHLTQTENMISKIEESANEPYLLRKLYMDAYEFSGSEYPQCRADMFRQLDEGVAWWNFIGHANANGWTGEKQLIYSDIKSMYLRHWPFIFAATCNFLRLDATAISGGELLFKERYGGAIGVLSAVRPVYINDNAMLSNAMGRALTQRNEQGRLLTPGEVCQRAKNDIRSTVTGRPTGDDNRLRYVFIGDPALPLATPSDKVRIDSIKGQPLGGDEPPVMAALERVALSGSITDPDGTVLTDFNGTVMIEIYDAERTVTTRGNGPEGVVKNYEDYGSRIYCGSTTVVGGRFTLTVAMPLEISQNYRPGAMSLYAYSTEDDTEAVGLCRDFYVYGYDETEAPDEVAPVIESMVLNHQSFADGAIVNTDPMLIAAVRDDIGINVSTAGVGHQMTIILDSRNTFSDVSNYFTPSSDGTPSGVINYPFEGLTAGAHSLELRVWDTSGNAASQTIDFFVAEGIAPKIYDVYTDANPASTQANFYLEHDQPDRMVTVGITVYNLMGRPVWSKVQSGRSDMFTTVPVTWDLTDTGGHRVGRGIYLYRATITADGQSYETASRRIAVTAR